MKRSFESIYDHQEEMVNLTPLLDVLFVVLILFMLAAPLLQIDKIDLSEGGPQSQQLNASPLLDIQVNANNQIFIGRKEVPIQLLVPVLKAMKQRFPDQTPTVYHDAKASFGTYQMLKNSLEEAGFHEMAIAVKGH